jgi:hypothetical protein
MDTSVPSVANSAESLITSYTSFLAANFPSFSSLPLQSYLLTNYKMRQTFNAISHKQQAQISNSKLFPLCCTLYLARSHQNTINTHIINAIQRNKVLFVTYHTTYFHVASLSHDSESRKRVNYG